MKTFKLKNQIGIDRVVFQIEPNGIPFQMPQALETKLSQKNVSFDLTESTDLYVAEDTKGRRYKRLIILLSEYEKVMISTIYNKLQVNIELKRIPMKNHEVLGNIENASYEVVDEQLQKVFNQLEKEYGICLDRNNVFVKNIEINRTFVFPYKFELCSDFFMYLLQEDSYYSSITYNKDFTDGEAMSRVIGNTTKIARKNRETVIYNKMLETLEWQKKFKNHLTIQEDIVRIEFRASCMNIIKHWFEKTNDWSKLNQEKIERAYKKCCEEYIFCAFNVVKQHRKECLEEFISSYKSTKDFKKNFLHFFIRFKDRCKYPLTISVDEFDCREAIKSNPMLNQNSKRFCKYYKEVVEEWTLYEDRKTASWLALEDIKDYIFGILKDDITPQTEVHYTL